MLSKLGKWVAYSSVFCTAGCGILGQKSPFDRNILFKSATSGCLNQFGKQFDNFLVGDVAESDWNTTWGCVDSTLTQFKTFARGSSPDGFTEQDIKMLLQNFLLTNKTISDDFVRSNLAIKASLIGGNSTLLAYKEVDHLRDLLTLIKNETTLLLPYMKARKLGNDRKALVAMSVAVSESARRMGAFLDSKPLQPLQKESLRVLLRELKTLFAWDIPVELIDAVFAAKVTVLSGSPDVIEGSVWNKAFQVGGTGAGSLLAIKGLQKGAQTDLLTDLIKAHEGMTFQMLAWQGGTLQFDKIDKIIDQLPSDWQIIDGEVLKLTLRNFTKRVLFSKTTDGFDTASIQTLYAFIDNWKLTADHVDGIFATFPAGTTSVSLPEFNLKANDYLAKQRTTLDQNAVRKIMDISKYRAMFDPNEDEIRFQVGVELSQTHMQKMTLFHLLAIHLMNCYSKDANGKVNPLGVTADNFKEIFDEFGPIAGQLHFIDLTFPNLYLKRFREADLFTFASDGNQWVNLDEATYYLAVIASSFSLSRKIRTDLEDVCQLDGSKDKLEWKWMDITCFRNSFKDSIGKYYKMFPMLKNFYNLLSDAGKNKLLSDMEKGYRLNGSSDVPIASYDIQSLAGYLHYIEALFLKYDGDQSQTLDKRELLTIFPVFRQLLSSSAKALGDNKTLLEAAFTYVVKFGHKPDESIWRTIHYALWALGRPFWKIDADRGSVYSIVPIMMATPPSTTELATTQVSAAVQTLLDNTTPSSSPAIDPNMFN